MTFDLPALAQEFLEYLEIERNLSTLTIRDYRHYLENFLKWQEQNCRILRPEQLTQDVVTIK